MKHFRPWWQNLRWWMKGSALSMLAVASAMVFTACGSKNNGGGPATGPGAVNPACVNCPGNTSLLASAVGRHYSGGVLKAEITLEFRGESAYLQQPGQVMAGVIPSYSGRVVAVGTLRVRQATQNTICNIPAGDYSVNTLVPGQWNMQSFWNLQLQANGPTQLTLNLFNNWLNSAMPAAVGIDGRQFPFSLNGFAQVNSMAGCMYPDEFIFSL
jgi:hypothetical protein